MTLFSFQKIKLFVHASSYVLKYSSIVVCCTLGNELFECVEKRSFADHSSVWQVLYCEVGTPAGYLTLGLKAVFDILQHVRAGEILMDFL